MIKRRTISLLVMLVLWLFFALYSWQTWFKGFDFIRLALGMLIYLLPGILSFFAWSKEEEFTTRSLLFGLTISIFVTGLFGVLARVFHLNFTFIRWAYALWGAGMIVLLWLRHARITLRFEKMPWWEAVLLLVVVGFAGYICTLASPPLIHDDAFTYNALLYYFQHAPAITFDFPDALNRLEIARFWIAYWPLVEAMISGFSGIDGLFITGTLLPPLLAGLSFLAVYTLARTLGLSRLLAGTAVLAQGFSLMRLSRQNQPGNLFFQRLTEDKVTAAFVLAPILLILVIEYFEDPTNRKAFLIWIAAWAMAFTHPVQFGMACMIAGVYGLPSLFQKNVRLKYFLLIGILASVVIVPYLFRFGGGEYSQTLSFSMSDVLANDELARLGVRRVDIIEGTQFYGLSHYLTTGLPYEIGLASALVSLFFFLRNKIARFVLASFAVLGFAMFPYTGWLVGMLTTPFQLWRLTWQVPFGLAIAFLVWFGFEIVSKIKQLNFMQRFLAPLFHGTVYILMVAAILYINTWTLGNVEKNNTDVTSIYENFVRVGAKLNELNINGYPMIVGGPDAPTNSVIPSLTLRFEPMVFRVETGGEKTKLWNGIFDENLTPDVRFARLKENDIQYVMLKGKPDWVTDLVNQYPDNVIFLFRDERYSLYQIVY